MPAGVGVNLRAVQRHRAHLQNAHLPRQQQHLNEQRLDLFQKPPPERRDGRANSAWSFSTSTSPKAGRRSWATSAHGAGGGAPKGNRNALKHGGFTAETVALRKEITALTRMAREAMSALE